MYKRILLAYDGSVKGRAALREGALMARYAGAKVFLLSVIAEAPGTRLADGAGASSAVHQQEDHKAVLKDGVTRLRQLGFDPEAKLVIGEPAQEIGAYADQIGADLVVVGHQRQSAFERWWSGPRGAYLIDHLHCERSDGPRLRSSRPARPTPNRPCCRLSVKSPMSCMRSRVTPTSS